MRLADPLPPPPRRVRFRAAARRWWPLGVTGVALVVCAVPIWIVLALSGVEILPFDDNALDAHAERAFGTIQAIERTSVHEGSTHFDAVSYRFQLGEAQTVDGSMLVPRGRYVVGDAVSVEYLRDQPAVNRLFRERRSSSTGLAVLIGLILLPGIVLTLLWVRSAFRLRLLLSEGRAAGAAIVSWKRNWYVNPPQLAVHYRFTDRTGRDQEGHHWIGRRSVLGKAIESGAIEVPVVFDEGSPEVSRLVTVADFA